MVLFIDTDPGTDDILALIHALKYSHHQVVGLSSVSGNLDIETTTRNMRLIAGYFNKLRHEKIEVYKGAAKPIIDISKCDASIYHGSDGCGNFYSSEYYKRNQSEIEKMIDSVTLSEKPAVIGLLEKSKKYTGELTIMALGPLTNVALAQIIDPEFGSRVKEILIMGGDLYGNGNSDKYFASEFNFSKDPEAAFVVIKEMTCKKTILPLEVNFDVAISKEIAETWIKKLVGRDDVLSNIMHSILSFHHKTYPSLELYDLMLAIIVSDPEVVTELAEMRVAVELEGRHTRGKLVGDYFDKCEKDPFNQFQPVNIVKKLNREKIFDNLDKLF